MIWAVESPAKRGYVHELYIQTAHKGIVKGKRMRVNVHCSVHQRVKKGYNIATICERMHNDKSSCCY